MFKKATAFLLTLVLIFTFAACGDSKSDKNISGKKESKVSSASSKTQSSNTASAVSKPKRDNTLWQRKMVVLTFDDSPFFDTGALLDLLKEKNVKATFFMIGQHMEEYPEIVGRAIDEGHDVGYHSYSHNINSSSSASMLATDFNQAQTIMDSINPDYKIKLLRTPGGQISDSIKQEAAKMDWRIINWTNYGFKDTDKETISPENRMMGVYQTQNGEFIRNGEIFLIHPYEGCTDTVTGIGLLIDKLKADGYEPVPMTELLKRRNGGVAGTVYNVPLY